MILAVVDTTAIAVRDDGVVEVDVAATEDDNTVVFVTAPAATGIVVVVESMTAPLPTWLL